MKGKIQTIYAAHNSDFTQAVEIFRLFDDSRINTLQASVNLKKMDPDFKICIYLDLTHECHFDALMFACFLKNTNLVTMLAYNEQTRTFILHPNREYCCGTSQYITPFSAICNNYKHNNQEERSLLELFLRSDCDLNKVDVFGEDLISPEMKALILSM
jgi:hypothetical protein